MGDEAVKEKVKMVNKCGNGGAGGAVYGLGFIGAFIYYVQNSETFVEGLVGLLKSMVWPAFLIHRVLQLLKM